MITISFNIAVVPFGPNFYVFDSNIGVLFFLVIHHLAFTVLFWAGASNNKYSLIGARSIGTNVNHEVSWVFPLMGSGDDGRRLVSVKFKKLKKWLCSFPQF